MRAIPFVDSIMLVVYILKLECTFKLLRNIKLAIKCRQWLTLDTSGSIQIAGSRGGCGAGDFKCFPRI